VKKIFLELGLQSLFLLTGSCILFSCGQIDPPPSNSVEVITTVKIEFHQVGGAHTQFFWRKLPGAATQIDTVKLQKGKSYSMLISFLNETDANNVLNVTAEIQNEGKDHQVFYTFSTTPAGIVTHSYYDQDSNGLPIGLNNQLETLNSATSSTGSMRLMLKHQPGVKTATSIATTGETDIDVTLPLVVN
jgi:hypothetical protein